MLKGLDDNLVGVVENCWNLLPGVDASYSAGASSALHSQTNGVLAGLTLVALVFVVKQHRNNRSGHVTVALLPVLFVASVGAAFEFAVVSGDRICERSAVLYLLASSLYLLSAVTITAVFRSLIRLNVQTDRRGRNPAQTAADAAFVIAGIAATLHYLVAWQDIAVEFGRSAGSLPSLLAPAAGAATAVTGAGRFLRGKPAAWVDALPYVFVVGAMFFILVNLLLFAGVSTVTNWRDKLDTFDHWWPIRYGVMAAVGGGIGLLWVVTHCDSTGGSVTGSPSELPTEVVDEWDLGPIHRRRTTRY